MLDKELYAAILGVPPHWPVASVKLSANEEKVRVWSPAAVWTLPTCLDWQLGRSGPLGRAGLALHGADGGARHRLPEGSEHQGRREADGPGVEPGRRNHAAPGSCLPCFKDVRHPDRDSKFPRPVKVLSSPSRLPPFTLSPVTTQLLTKQKTPTKRPDPLTATTSLAPHSALLPALVDNVSSTALFSIIATALSHCSLS